ASAPLPPALGVGAARPHLDAMRLRLFESRMFVTLAVRHAYVGVRLLPPFNAVTQILGAALLRTCLWLLPNSIRFRKDRGLWAVLLPSLAMGFFSWLLVLTLGRDLSFVVSVLALSPQDQQSWI